MNGVGVATRVSGGLFDVSMGPVREIWIEDGGASLLSSGRGGRSWSGGDL